VFDDVVLSAVIPVTSFWVEPLFVIWVATTLSKREIPSSFRDALLWPTVVAPLLSM